MDYTYFTVGPSQIHPRLKEFVDKAFLKNIPSISHRGEAFEALHKDLGQNIHALLELPGTYHIFYTGSATEWMERIVQNCSQKETLHFVSGVFSGRFWEIAQALGRNAVLVKNRPDYSFSLEDIPVEASLELVCLTHNETTSGTMLPRQFIREIRNRFPSSVIAMDIVSSIPTCDVDFSDVDIIFFSVQKGMGLPAGLGVLLANDRAIQFSQKIQVSGAYTGSHHSFENLLSHELKLQTPETPNVLNMYLLNEVCKDFLATGKEKLMADMHEKARILREAIQKVSSLELVVKNPDFQSQTVLVAHAKEGSGSIIKKLTAQGIVIASGYGEQKNQFIRIGNFPAHTLIEVKRLAGLICHPQITDLH